MEMMMSQQYFWGTPSFQTNLWGHGSKLPNPQELDRLEKLISEQQI